MQLWFHPKPESNAALTIPNRPELVEYALSYYKQISNDTSTWIFVASQSYKDFLQNGSINIVIEALL